MSEISIKCKNCESELKINFESKIATCEHCGATFYLSDLLDEKDTLFLEFSSQKVIDKKIKLNEKLKKGEVCIFKGEFLRAEENFKQAIEIDPDDFRGYFGLVKAKTKNLNKIPDVDDYKQYAKIALSLSYGDEHEHIKSELSKLHALEIEKKQLQKENKQKIEQLKKNEQLKRIKSNFFSNLAYCLTGLIAFALLFGIVISMIIEQNEDKTTSASTIEISTVAEFLNFASDTSKYNCTIILTADLDFDGEIILPIGTATNPFTGKFYGNKHTIKNFKISSTSDGETLYFGLFGFCNGATISGIILDDVEIEFENSNNLDLCVGLICAYAENSSFKQCSASSNCYATLTLSKNNIVAGVVGNLKNGEIGLCYSNAEFNLTNELQDNIILMGGVCANSLNSQISNSYSASIISINSETQPDYAIIAGVVGNFEVEGENSSATLTLCAFLGQILCSTQIENLEIGGIVGSTNTSIGINYVLFENDSFLIAYETLDIENLIDSDFENIQFLSQDEFLQIINIVFSDVFWKNASTFMPEFV